MNKAEKLKYPWKKWEDDNGDRFYRITTESGKEYIVSQFIGDLLHQANQENKELRKKVDSWSEKYGNELIKEIKKKFNQSYLYQTRENAIKFQSWDGPPASLSLTEHLEGLRDEIIQFIKETE